MSRSLLYQSPGQYRSHSKVLIIFENTFTITGRKMSLLRIKINIHSRIVNEINICTRIVIMNIFLARFSSLKLLTKQVMASYFT